MVKNIFLLSLISCFLFGETKIGYIDSQIILTQYEDVRQVQVELEKEQKKLQAVYEKNFLIDDVYNADELFVTGTFAGIIPVSKLEDRDLKSTNPDSLANQIRFLYNKYVQENIN